MQMIITKVENITSLKAKSNVFNFSCYQQDNVYHFVSFFSPRDAISGLKDERHCREPTVPFVLSRSWFQQALDQLTIFHFKRSIILVHLSQFLFYFIFIVIFYYSVIVSLPYFCMTPVSTLKYWSLCLLFCPSSVLSA